MNPPGRGHFVTTRWSLVLAAGGDVDSAGAREALATLCSNYWYPLYAFLRSRGQSAQNAEDLTQAFFARLLEKQTIEHADPARGRFRSFLLASLKNFVANEHERDAAQKRGGGVSAVSLEAGEDRFQLEPATTETPERTFDRRWALALLECVITRLEAEMTRDGNHASFAQLKAYLTGDAPQPTYAETARLLDMSEGAIKVAVHRLRKRFRAMVLEEIAQTVSSPGQVDDELRHLWSSVAAR
jgi:RNA polymerase sigma factor (sigma-70 family)